MNEKNGKSTNTLIEIKDVCKSFNSKAGEFKALNGINFTVSGNEFIAITGKSGSGKTTLLNMIAGIDRPTSGKVFVTGTPVHQLSENQTSIWRGKNIGIVFQFFQLIPTLSALENVILPMDFCNTFPYNQRSNRAMKLLERVGLGEHAHKFPQELSGGEQQRVAIARALANDPQIIIADEPTGNLDTQTANSILQLFDSLVKEGKTVIMVTHERNGFIQFTRTCTLVDGVIVKDTNN